MLLTLWWYLAGTATEQSTHEKCTNISQKGLKDVSLSFSYAKEGGGNTAVLSEFMKKTVIREPTQFVTWALFGKMQASWKPISYIMVLLISGFKRMMFEPSIINSSLFTNIFICGCLLFDLIKNMLLTIYRNKPFPSLLKYVAKERSNLTFKLQS